MNAYQFLFPSLMMNLEHGEKLPMFTISEHPSGFMKTPMSCLLECAEGHL